MPTALVVGAFSLTLLPPLCYSLLQPEGNKKKRKRDPSKAKRAHTAYTMFVQENYEVIKKNLDPNVPSKDIISIVARQWAETSEEEKQVSSVVTSPSTMR